MTRDLADESALLVKVHSLEVRVIAREDLAGLWDNPDLGWVLIKGSLLGADCRRHASELSSSMTGCGRYITGFLLNRTWLRELLAIVPLPRA